MSGDGLKLIAGLGNPGIRYRMNRHNAGFMVLDQVALLQDISMDQNLFEARVGRGKIEGTPVLLVEPQTYMNLSGIAIGKLANYYRIHFEDLIIVHDDLDLPFRTLRLKAGGGHGGHKGLISIVEHLGTRDFLRVRFGIGRPARKTMVEGYVLEPFPSEEMEDLPQMIGKAAEAVTDIVTLGIRSAIQKHHANVKIKSNEED